MAAWKQAARIWGRIFMEKQRAIGSIMVWLHAVTPPRRALSDLSFGSVLDGGNLVGDHLFGGNLVRQPAFVQLRQDNAAAYRVVGGLEGSDRLMAAGLFIGVYPGLTTPMLDYVIQVIHEFCRMQKKGSQAL